MIFLKVEFLCVFFNHGFARVCAFESRAKMKTVGLGYVLDVVCSKRMLKFGPQGSSVERRWGRSSLPS